MTDSQPSRFLERIRAARRAFAIARDVEAGRDGDPVAAAGELAAFLTHMEGRIREVFGRVPQPDEAAYVHFMGASQLARSAAGQLPPDVLEELVGFLEEIGVAHTWAALMGPPVDDGASVIFDDGALD